MRITCVFVVFTAAVFAQLPPVDQKIADLTELIDRKPDFAGAYYARGATRLAAGQYQMAELDLSKAIELKPDAMAYARRAELYAAMKRADPEIADLTAAIRMKPRNPTYYIRRANSYRAKGDCQLAAADYSEAILIQPTPEAYRLRAACRKQLGDIAGAAEDERAIEQMNAPRNAPPPIPLNSIIGAIPSTAPQPLNPAGGVGSGSGGGAIPKIPALAPSQQNVYRIGGGVSPPSLLFKVEPEYSEEARKAKWQGTVALSIVVDEFGEPRDVKVTGALGMGLDGEAIDAVQKWVFKPGQKDGQPVAVYANIVVTFHLL
jgi:TonB family protein